MLKFKTKSCRLYVGFTICGVAFVRAKLNGFRKVLKSIDTVTPCCFSVTALPDTFHF